MRSTSPRLTGSPSKNASTSGEQPAPTELSTLGHLTTLVCGTDFNETNYPEQLSELTI